MPIRRIKRAAEVARSLNVVPKLLKFASKCCRAVLTRAKWVLTVDRCRETCRDYVFIPPENLLDVSLDRLNLAVKCSNRLSKVCLKVARPLTV